MAPTRMLRDETGTVGMMTGLLMTLLVPSVIAAVDLSNITATKEKVQGRLDGAIIAAAQFEDLSDAADSGAMQERGHGFVMNALEGSGIAIKNATSTFTYNERDNVIDAIITFDTPTIFVGSVFDVERVVVTAQLTPKDAIELEVALSLDISGSMGWEIASDDPAPVGSRRIDALKQGVDSMIAVFDENPLVDARLSVIPYASAVNISATNERQSSNGNWKNNGNNNGQGNGYAYGRNKNGRNAGGGNTWAAERAERSGAGKMQISLAPPRSGNTISKKSDLDSPTTSVLPLSKMEDAASHIATMKPAGSTAGHIGAEWALYSLLPDWHDVWDHPEKPPADMGSETRKIIVMMTDGDFTVTQTPDMSVEDAYEIFQDVCAKARDNGIAVYTVGLKASAKTDTELTECAGTADHYFSVNSRAAMAEAFKKIGEDATKLRISE